MTCVWPPVRVSPGGFAHGRSAGDQLRRCCTWGFRKGHVFLCWRKVQDRCRRLTPNCQRLTASRRRLFVLGIVCLCEECKNGVQSAIFVETMCSVAPVTLCYLSQGAGPYICGRMHQDMCCDP